jgi:UDP-3-O-[3-hydroxymyristoyl] glucosamine N-acyltransferase
LNRGIQIGHDCSIGDFFSAMPGSVISGTNTIGDRVYFGANSTTREKITITNDCTFGLNSGIVKDITEPGTYVGTPSKKIK